LRQAVVDRGEKEQISDRTNQAAQKGEKFLAGRRKKTKRTDEGGGDCSGRSKPFGYNEESMSLPCQKA